MRYFLSNLCAILVVACSFVPAWSTDKYFTVDAASVVDGKSRIAAAHFAESSTPTDGNYLVQGWYAVEAGNPIPVRFIVPEETDVQAEEVGKKWLGLSISLIAEQSFSVSSTDLDKYYYVGRSKDGGVVSAVVTDDPLSAKKRSIIAWVVISLVEVIISPPAICDPGYITQVEINLSGYKASCIPDNRG